MKNKFLFLLFVLLQRFCPAQTAFSVISSRNGIPDSAVVYAQNNVNSAREKKDSAALVEATCKLAQTLTALSFYTRAEKITEECLDWPFVKKNQLYQGKIYRELGNIQRYASLYAESIENYYKAHTLFEKLAAWNDLVKCEAQIAEYYRRTSKHKIGKQYIDEALKKYQKYKLSDTTLLIYIYNRAAAIDNESNPDPRATISNSRMAFHLAILSNNTDAQAVSMNELGYTYKNIHRTDSAEILYKRAEELWLKNGNYRDALNAMSNRAMLYDHNGYPVDKAMQVYQEIISITNEKKINFSLARAYDFLYQTSLKRKDSGAALRYFYLYHDYTVQEVTLQNDIRTTNITERYESEKAKQEIKRVNNELYNSKEQLEKKEAEARRMYVYITTLIALLGTIVFLLFRIKRTNKKLADRNKEKDVLIQEIHHRVKNNLQFISSLINMQMNSSNDSREILTLNDASRRIRAMALVHEMLYNNKEMTGIPIKSYLNELIISLNQLVNSEQIPISFKLNFADEVFKVSESIALGMITSELVSNSIKHAFQQTEKPEIEISLTKENDNANFVYRDNGKGLPAEKKAEKSLGLRLIDIFSRQIKGKYSIETDKGFIYKLQFNRK